MRKSFSISILFISLFVIPMTNILAQAQWRTLILPDLNADVTNIVSTIKSTKAETQQEQEGK